MYERSAIVLERYLSKIFGQDPNTSIKANYDVYKDILEEMKNYQTITQEEEKIIDEFDEIAKKMQTIQKKQELLCSENIENEEERNKLFNDFDQDPAMIEKKILKLEKAIEDNEDEQKEIREKYISLLFNFSEKQKERNRCSKSRRNAESTHMQCLTQTAQKIELIDNSLIKKAKEFITVENDTINQSVIKIMLDNGKNEKVKFDSNVIKKAVEARIDIAKKEAECYVNIYDKLRKLMAEIEGDSVKLGKYEKALKDTQIKLNFLNAEKEYIISFLDNERMTAINGEKMHKQMMQEAVKNFDKDMAQIQNLYGLILREITGKATKKAYKDLYNSTYLVKMEETEKSFNKEVNAIKANLGTIINTNYWRIEGIKNIYEVFNKEIEETFERDLTEFMPEEVEEEEEEKVVAAVSKIEEPKLESIIEDEIEEDDDTEEWFISNDEIEEKDDKEDDDDYEEEYDEDDDYEEEYDDEEEYEENDEENDDEYDSEDDYEEENDDFDFFSDDEDDEDEDEDEDEKDDEEDEEELEEIIVKKEPKRRTTRDEKLKEEKFEALREKVQNRSNNKKRKTEVEVKEKKNEGRIFGKIFGEKKK